MLTVQFSDVAGDLGVDRRGLERLELARLAHAAADGVPLGMDDLDRSRGLGRRSGLAFQSGRSHPVASAVRAIPVSRGVHMGADGCGA